MCEVADTLRDVVMIGEKSGNLHGADITEVIGKNGGFHGKEQSTYSLKSIRTSDP